MKADHIVIQVKKIRGNGHDDNGSFSHSDIFNNFCGPKFAAIEQKLDITLEESKEYRKQNEYLKFVAAGAISTTFFLIGTFGTIIFRLKFVKLVEILQSVGIGK